MLQSRISKLAVAAALALPMLIGCGSKGGDKPDSTSAPATQAPAPPPPPSVAPPPVAPIPGDPTVAVDTCKKNFATTCALPCEKNAQNTIKDPARQKTALNQCMVACLEQADRACVKH